MTGPRDRSPWPDRFWNKVDKTGGCWLWTGGATGRGYGAVVSEGRLRPAHRVGWELQVGPIPAGLFVLHHCDVRLCVRAGHLFLGTHADNMADMVAKGRQATGDRVGARLYPEKYRSIGEWATLNRHRRQGSRNAAAKLTEADIPTIRRRLADGETLGTVANAYGVSKSAISRISLRLTWPNVP